MYNIISYSIFTLFYIETTYIARNTTTQLLSTLKDKDLRDIPVCLHRDLTGKGVGMYTNFLKTTSRAHLSNV